MIVYEFILDILFILLDYHYRLRFFVLFGSITVFLKSKLLQSILKRAKRQPEQLR